jgi:2'-5' RNA ligase
VAIPLDAAVRARLASAAGDLRASARGVAWVAESNLHVTVKFLGGVAPSLLADVGRALGDALAPEPAFVLGLRGLGAFPAARARVIWAGLGGGGPSCAAIAERVERALEPLGFPRETRAFSPHVTLGRVRQPRRDEKLAAALRAAASADLGSTRVAAVSLIRSDLSPAGARYTELASCPLLG